LNDLERDPLSTADRLDWSAKRVLYGEYLSAEGVRWHDDVMQSLDMEYHNVDERASLHAGLEQSGSMLRISSDQEIADAVRRPPENTRAYGRGLIVSQLLARPGTRYVIDWDAAYIERNRQLDMKNPFHTYEKEAWKFARAV
jgi:proteasome accessory factor A